MVLPVTEHNQQRAQVSGIEIELCCALCSLETSGHQPESRREVKSNLFNHSPHENFYIKLVPFGLPFAAIYTYIRKYISFSAIYLQCSPTVRPHCQHASIKTQQRRPRWPFLGAKSAFAIAVHRTGQNRHRQPAGTFIWTTYLHQTIVNLGANPYSWIRSAVDVIPARRKVLSNRTVNESGLPFLAGCINRTSVCGAFHQCGRSAFRDLWVLNVHQVFFSRRNISRLGWAINMIIKVNRKSSSVNRSMTSMHILK